MKRGNDLRALYYPFSRVTDLSSLKQFLILYDQTTFLDPVTDENWRKRLLSDLEGDHPEFGEYSDLAENFPALIAEGAVRIIDPVEISSKNSELVTASIVSDLADDNWLRLCNPASFGMPFERDSSGKPLWQIFRPKIPERFLEAVEDNSQLSKHVIASGGEDYSWHLTYSAGSAVTLNVHMSAAEELGLQLVSDSKLHNRLLLAKLERKLKSSSEPADGFDHAGRIANGVMISVLDKLLPPHGLSLVSVEEILRFRESTATMRGEFATEIRNLVKKQENYAGDKLSDLPDNLTNELIGSVKNYGNELQSVRDTIWPRLIGSITSAAPVSASGAGYVASYISGSGYLMAASLLLHALTPIKSALEIRADLNKVRRSPTSAIAFLVKARELANSK